MKMHAIETELFNANGRVDGQTDRQTDRQTDVKKRIIAFPNFANAPKIFHYLLGHTKINDKLRRLLREETIL